MSRVVVVELQAFYVSYGTGSEWVLFSFAEMPACVCVCGCVCVCV